MRILLLTALAIAALVAVPGATAAEPLDPMDTLVPGGVATHLADAVDAAAASPEALPDIVGHADVVHRAAALASTALGAEELATIAAEQQLRAALEPAKPLAWKLGRFVPPVPAMPLATVVAPEAPGLALPAPARAAVAVVGVMGLASLAFPKLPLLPLYSRIQREEAMLNSRRSQLYELVRTEPGIHLSDLVRRSGLGWGAALYHLGVLEKNRMLVAHDEGGFKRYFANGMHRPQEMQRLVALRHGPAKQLFEAVLALPGRSGRELAENLGLSPSTLARASERLEEAGMLRRVRAGRRVLYFPAGDAPEVAPVAVAA